METIRLSEAGVEAAALRAAALLRGGGVILYPTDTLYGLGVDALSDGAVAKIYALKGRGKEKPIHCVVSDLEMAAEYADVNDVARKLARDFLPGPLTLVLKKKSGINTGIAKRIDTIGIRIPDNDFCLALARKFGKPYTTTSANASGMEPLSTVDGILTQLGDNARYIDLIIDAGELSKREPSTVVDLSGGTPLILREGAIRLPFTK